MFGKVVIGCGPAPVTLMPRRAGCVPATAGASSVNSGVQSVALIDASGSMIGVTDKVIARPIAMTAMSGGMIVTLGAAMPMDIATEQRRVRSL